MHEAYLSQRLREALSLAGPAVGPGQPSIDPRTQLYDRDLIQHSDRRVAIRHPGRIAAMLHYVGSQPWRVFVSDLSTCGFRIELEVPLRTGRLVALEINGLSQLEAYVVWQDGEQVGCKFLNEIHPALVEAALAIGSHVQ